MTAETYRRGALLLAILMPFVALQGIPRIMCGERKRGFGRMLLGLVILGSILVFYITGAAANLVLAAGRRDLYYLFMGMALAGYIWIWVDGIRFALARRRESV